MSSPGSSKQRVQSHWDEEPCGTRGLGDPIDGSDAFFEQTEALRVELDGALIAGFAEFPKWAGKRVLEIGVGAGVDFLNWSRAGARAIGIDLTPHGARLTRSRLAREGLVQPVMVADAENLPFPSNSFDLVYSWGVLHHTPDTEASISEVWRVLAPGGEARVMLYHLRSWVALQAWVRYGLLTGKPWVATRPIIARHVESPGTKAYTVAEARRLFGAFSDVSVQPRLTAYDLLEHTPRAAHVRGLLGPLQRLYPRRLARSLGDRWGWNLLIRARKAQAAPSGR